jgi:hypothetical protein
MIQIDTADARLLERNEARAYRVERGGAMNAIFDVVEDQALDGQVVKFDVPFPYKGDLIMLRAGCFGDINNQRVAFRLDHEASLEVASTDDGLEVIADDDGVQFRLDLSKCKLGPLIARMCKSDNRSAMSVGSNILDEHKEVISGETVRVVTRARMTELSLCKEGAAGNNAFAVLVDKTFTPKPVAGSRSATFNAAYALHKVSRNVRKLKAAIAATYDAAPPVRRSMTLDESNRLQTAENERLVAYARKVHGIPD